MTLQDAAQAVADWLTTQPITFLSTANAVEIEPQHFKIGIHQVKPERKRRVFELAPLDVPDCYEMKEIAA